MRFLSGIFNNGKTPCQNGGDVLVKNVIPKHLESISAKLEEAGAEIIEYDDAVRVTRFKPLTKCNVKTMPHPGFPTDMQPQIAVLLSVAKGKVFFPRVYGTTDFNMSVSF